MRTLAFLTSITFAAGFLAVACGSTPSAETPKNGEQTPGGDAGAPPMKACTMDAKMCPDGTTSVGRQGPNCEFAPCPGEK